MGNESPGCFMGWQEAHTQIRVQAYRCRWGYSETHLLCLCQSQRVFGALSGWIAFLLWFQKTYCLHPLFVGGSIRDRSYPGPMSRGQRRLLLTHCVMWDAGCVWTRILNKIPYKNQSRCFLVCCCRIGARFPLSVWWLWTSGGRFF